MMFGNDSLHFSLPSACPYRTQAEIARQIEKIRWYRINSRSKYQSAVDKETRENKKKVKKRKANRKRQAHVSTFSFDSHKKCILLRVWKRLKVGVSLHFPVIPFEWKLSRFRYLFKATIQPSNRPYSDHTHFKIVWVFFFVCAYILVYDFAPVTMLQIWIQFPRSDSLFDVSFWYGWEKKNNCEVPET